MSRRQQIRDDLGHLFVAPPATDRVVSLVPSLTESIALSRLDALVGATDWCTHPSSLKTTRVRGTKNPNLAKVLDLQPDVVLANKEENRKTDVMALRDKGVPVWVTDITTVDDAFASLRRVFRECLRWPLPGWLLEAEDAWRTPPVPGRQSVVIPVWRDPWMVVGRDTFTGDVAARVGLRNLYEHHDARYPRVDVAQIRNAAPDIVLLPDEPYRFTAEDGPEAFPGQRVALASGRSLTWYGPSLRTARDVLGAQIANARRYP